MPIKRNVALLSAASRSAPPAWPRSVGAMALVLAPALWILRTTERRTPCPAQ